jgi:tripartite-type tricarboxylate transporter receptor subunit TctC
MNRLWKIAVASAALLACQAAQAQAGAENYPSKPVAMILPFAPGGSPDVAARKLAEKLALSMGKPFLVDFRPGGGTGIASSYVARSAPDGYTLLYVTNSFTVLPAVTSKGIPYDPVKDFEPLVLLSKQPSFLLVNPALPVRNLKEYIAYAKAHPDGVNFGMVGVGGGNHLSAAWLHSLMGVKVTFVPYKGSTLLPLVGGELQASAATVSAALSFVKAGKLRAIANTDSVRSPALPDVPTVAEQGVAGFEFAPWQGWLAPAGIAPPIARKLEGEFIAALKSADLLDTLSKTGTVPIGGTGAEFRKLLAAELVRWKKVALEYNITTDE